MDKGTKVIILFVLSAVMIPVIIGTFVYQNYKYEECETALKKMSVADVSKIVLYYNDFPKGYHIDITDKVAIASFLSAIKDINKYSPSHENVSGELCLIILPLDIHLILKRGANHPNKVLGNFGRFTSESSYFHYGSFLSKNLSHWFNHYTLARGG